MTQPLERGIPYSPEVKLVGKMSKKDFETLAKRVGGVTILDTTIINGEPEEFVSEIRFPSLDSKVLFYKGHPNASKGIDSIHYVDWGESPFSVTFNNCAVILGRNSASFVNVPELVDGSIVNVLTFARGGVTLRKTNIIGATEENILKAVSIIAVSMMNSRRFHNAKSKT